ncbi:MAG: LuxR C-terminal-related transcriptional regulator [Pseudomonadota bacterium]|nr:LuxR C-terminal-related transcriptional regulator [Pseudomonadota bacterium]
MVSPSSSLRAPDASQDLMLKVTPPRAPRDQVPRTQLPCTGAALRGFPVLVVQAPAGFGKTALLTQWRKELQATGLPVAWVSAQAHDHPARLVRSLALAVRVASGQPGFGRASFGFDGGNALEHVTVFLAELAQSAQETALLIDEADKLPEASRQALTYLLHQAPPNLRILLSVRADCPLDVDELIAYGQCRRVDAADLRFGLDETLQLARARLGGQADPTLAARLHALTEGWPLGLQLALSIVSHGGSASADTAGMAALYGQLQQQLVKQLLASLDAADRDFLVRIAMLDLLHPGLCQAVTGDAGAAQRLERLSRQTPIFTSGEDGAWQRMHALARDALRQHFAALPEAQRLDMHGRAAQWLARQGLLEEAARHALTAGQHQSAYDLAERSLYESLMQRGQHTAVLDWLERMPAHELDRRPRLLMAMAWTLASSERHAQAQRFVARIQALPDVTEAMRRECALLLCGAAVFADEPDRYVQLHTPWAQHPPPDTALLRRVHANRMAYRALLAGEPAQARHLLHLPAAPAAKPGTDSGGEGGLVAGADGGYAGHWAGLIAGLSYVWEGQVHQAGQLLAPALARAEAELGRRHRLSCMLAALLAAATWEGGHASQAAALLADRLDILERSGLPETLLLAYRSAARMAVAQGAEHHALELLGALDAAAAARQLPRLRIASLSEQVRLHARSWRAQTCRDLCDDMARLIHAEAGSPAGAAPALRGLLWLGGAQALHDQALAFAALAARDWASALPLLARADAHARQMRLGRLHIELLALRALALERSGQAGQPLMQEAMDLARAYGLRRVLIDAHPELAEWIARLNDAGSTHPPQPAPATLPAPAVPAPPAPSLPAKGRHGGMLTPKEHEVLTLLARSLSNKEIGRAMNVGETTIKWHVKNLFAKLDAGTRKQVVQRARILGLIEAQ